MSTNVTAQRPPSPCSKHPEGQAVNTATRQSGPLRLRQHRCANGCDIPLGWDFTNHAEGVFLHGPDQCQDPRVEVAFEVWRSKAIAAPIIAVAITTGCLILAVMAAAAITAVCQNSTDDALFILKGLVITAPVEAACLLAIRTLRRRRPPEPEYSDTERIQPAPLAALCT